MNEEQLREIFENLAQRFVEQLKVELNRPRIHAPGFKGGAYSEGRNSKFRVSTPTSPFGSTLNKSIQVTDLGDNQYGVTMADHWENVVTGMNPQPKYLKGKGSGTSPFITALQKWAQSRGIPTGAAFAIRRNIWKYGIKPFNFIAAAEDAILDQLENELEDDLFEYIEETFDQVITTERRQF